VKKKGSTIWGLESSAFQTKGAACAKALRWEQDPPVLRLKRTVWQKEEIARDEAGR
jgi:hypothetical protein